LRFLSKQIAEIPHGLRNFFIANSRNSARLAEFFYRHFPYAVCSLFKTSDGISKLWRCVVAATPTSDYLQERAPPPSRAFSNLKTNRSIPNAMRFFSSSTIKPNPKHSKPSLNGNHPPQAGKRRSRRLLLRRPRV